MKLCKKNNFVNYRATVLALTFVCGTAKRKMKNTSIPDNAYLYIGDRNGPAISICIISPGKDCNDDSSCKGGVWYLLEDFFSGRHVRQSDDVKEEFCETWEVNSFPKLF